MQVMEHEISRYEAWNAELEKKRNNILAISLNVFWEGDEVFELTLILRSFSFRKSCSKDYFKIVGSANTPFQLNLKESMHIFQKPNLNSQGKFINLTLTL